MKLKDIADKYGNIYILTYQDKFNMYFINYSNDLMQLVNEYDRLNNGESIREYNIKNVDICYDATLKELEQTTTTALKTMKDERYDFNVIMLEFLDMIFSNSIYNIVDFEKAKRG